MGIRSMSDGLSAAGHVRNHLKSAMENGMPPDRGTNGQGPLYGDGSL